MKRKFDKAMDRVGEAMDKVGEAIDKVGEAMNTVFDKDTDSTTIRITLSPEHVTRLLGRKRLTFKVSDDTTIFVEMK